MSRDASRARSVTPLRWIVASAISRIGFAGLRSRLSSTSHHALPFTCLVDLRQPSLDLLAKLVGDRDVAALDLDLHGETS